MTALSNSRLNTVTGQVDWRDMDYEVHTCAEFDEVSGQFGIKVQDDIHSMTLGRKRVGGLVISSITRPGGNTSRFNFSGSPDLSSVQVGDYLHRKSCTSSANNGRDIITAVSDASDYIEITDADGVAQVGAAGEAAVSYGVHTSVVGAPAVGEFAPDTRYGLGRVVLNSAEDGNDFVAQYQGGGSAHRKEDASNVPDGSVTNAKLADMAQARFKMRAAGAGTGAPIDGTPAQAWAALGLTPNFIDIGDWNMDSTPTLNVAHGLTYSKIVAVTGYVRDDADSIRDPIPSSGHGGTSGANLKCNGWDATNVILERENTSVWDSASYDATSYNRGVLIVWTIP